MKYIDIHCHLNFPEYDLDREEVIARAQKEEIGMINVGIDVPTSEASIELAEKYGNIWATVGVHPHEAKNPFDIEVLKKLAKHPKVVAIGECGLDYMRSEAEEIEKQKEVFLKHISLANEVGKPLMLHVRNGKENKNAYPDAILMLKKHAKIRADFHFFSGNLEDLKKIIDINGTVSFTGVVTFARNYDEVVKNVPSDRILSETDAPLVAPIPYRGKRNEPLFIKEILKSLAQIRGDSEDKLRGQIIDNARRLFSI